MHQKLKLSHIRHTGRLRPHEHTSYIPLAFLLLVTGFTLVMATTSDFAQADTGPTTTSVSLTGTVPEAPPKTAATIDSPKNGQHFGNTPIDVSGTCPNNTLVEVFKNKIFAGSVPCDNQKYTLKIDLMYGQNTLSVQDYDALNQAGPASPDINVFYDALPPQGAPTSDLTFVGAQLVLSTNAVYRGTFPGQTLNVPITILGGTPPFAVNINWGDSTNKVVPRGDNAVFNAPHVYKKPGTYEISLQGSDSKQLVAYLQVAAIVNGQPSALVSSVNGGGGSGSKSPVSKFLVLWPVFAMAVTLVGGFWVGERREKKIMTKINAMQSNPFAAPPPPQPHQ